MTRPLIIPRFWQGVLVAVAWTALLLIIALGINGARPDLGDWQDRPVETCQGQCPPPIETGP
jgi:hypothetical protein